MFTGIQLQQGSDTKEIPQVNPEKVTKPIDDKGVATDYKVHTYPKCNTKKQLLRNLYRTLLAFLR